MKKLLTILFIGTILSMTSAQAFEVTAYQAGSLSPSHILKNHPLKLTYGNSPTTGSDHTEYVNTDNAGKAAIPVKIMDYREVTIVTVFGGFQYKCEDEKKINVFNIQEYAGKTINLFCWKAM